MYKPSISLYLSQFYKDSKQDYVRSLVNDDFPSWDYVIITAGNEKQAEGYRLQIANRRLPPRTHFAVVPDENGERVGSGGATLSVIKYIVDCENKKGNYKGNIFSRLRILVIHSGGDSRRIPQYSALGKLFSPVPNVQYLGENAFGNSSSLFDELLSAMASMPARIPSGMMLLSGDVLLLFNPLMVDYSGKNAAVISFKEKVNVAVNHGVYLKGEDGNVKRFLHKQSAESLTELGAVNESGDVDIDTGAVIFSADILKSLYEMIDTEEKYQKIVNPKVRLSLYGDFQYVLASDSTIEMYLREKPEGVYCDELTDARIKVWEALRSYRMKLVRAAPSKFIHFGTTKELHKLMTCGIADYSELGWTHKVNSSIECNASGYNSVVSPKATVGENCYFEASYIHSSAKIGNNCIVSYTDVHDEIIPDDVVVHSLKLRDGKFVSRIYGLNDNPKESLIFGVSIEEFCQKSKLSISYGGEHSLWNARLYVKCDSVKESLKTALELYDYVVKGTDVDNWNDYNRISLSEGFNDADPMAIIDWNKRMDELVKMGRLSEIISKGKPIKDASGLFDHALTSIQKKWISDRVVKEKTDYSELMRIHYYVGNLIGGKEGEKEKAECFRSLRNAILNNVKTEDIFSRNPKFALNNHKVELPLRVNWGGGWTDTPPYCNENGGIVLNAAIKLNGNNPVSVMIEKTDELKVVFDSRDMDVHGEFTDIDELRETGNPFDSFALQKAALLACGIISKNGGSLREILSKFGGGFIIHSEVVGVPKGSGLGTSSILAAACARCILEFAGVEYTDKELCDYVVAMEQIMSTGGGWQDQIGGLFPGIKLIQSNPGLKQDVSVYSVGMTKDALDELNSRFVLIYTGQRRLARNILREVVGKYISNDETAITALNAIKGIAVSMKDCLENGDIDGFADLLNEHWKQSCIIDEGTTNTLINQIFDSIHDLIDGKMVCGAGGGGFLQVIMKKGVTSNELHARLKDVFSDSPIDVWDCEII